MADRRTHTVVVGDTVSGICKKYNISKSNLKNYNRQEFNPGKINYKSYADTALRISVGYTKDEHGVEYAKSIIDFCDYDRDGKVTASDARYLLRISSIIEKGVTEVGDFLVDWSDKDPLPYNLKIYIEPKNTGGVSKEDNPDVFSTYSGLGLSDKILQGQHLSVVGNGRAFNSYFIRYSGDTAKEIVYLPVVPQELTDSNSASFSEQSMYGRSVAYKIYNSSSRSVSFSLTLHEELDENDYGYVREVVRKIESCCYPEYGQKDAIYPPTIEFRIVNQFVIRGILESCSAVWSPPFNYTDDFSNIKYSTNQQLGKLSTNTSGQLVGVKGYRNCTISVSVTETTGPYRMSDIASFGGNRTLENVKLSRSKSN